MTLIALAAFVGVALLAMQQSRLLVNRLHTIGELGVRISNWGAAVDQWATAPTFGTGAGTHLYYGRYFRRPEIQADPEHAHSDYLETLAEYGLVGFAGMSFLVFIHCYSGMLAVGASAKTASAEPFAPIRDNRIALQIGSLSALAAYLVHSMTDFNLHVPGNALMFAFFFGIMANPDPEILGAPVAAVSPVSRTRFFPILLPVLGVCILVVCGPRFRGDYWTERTRAALHYRDPRSAAAFAQKALVYETRNPFTYYLLGQAWATLAQAEPNPVLRRDVLEKSVAATRGALAIFPQDEQALALLARVLDSLKRYREAGQVYERAIGCPIQSSPNCTPTFMRVTSQP